MRRKNYAQNQNTVKLMHILCFVSFIPYNKCFHFPSVSALLFSATFRKKIEKLARDILIDPIRVVQGDIGEVWCCFFFLKSTEHAGISNTKK